MPPGVEGTLPHPPATAPPARAAGAASEAQSEASGRPQGRRLWREDSF